MKAVMNPPIACALALVFAATACGASPLLVNLSDDGTATGGSSSTGGARQTGGASGTGGVSGSTGGNVSTGGTSGTGGGPSCGAGKSCGGNVLGTWTVTSSCLTVDASLDFSLLGLSCPAPRATGSLNVEGTWGARAGTFKDDTVTWGTLNFALSPACLRLSGTAISCEGIGPLFSILLGNSSCRPRADGGCDCVANIKQSGSIGTVRPGSGVNGGAYMVAGSTLVTDGAKYDFCVTGDSPVMSLQPRDGLVSGFVSLRRTGN